MRWKERERKREKQTVRKIQGNVFISSKLCRDLDPKESTYYDLPIGSNGTSQIYNLVSTLLK